MVDDGAMTPGTVMVEAQNPFPIGSNAYHLESHALTDGRQVEHIPIGGKERQVMRLHKAPDAGSRIMDCFEQYRQVVSIFLR